MVLGPFVSFFDSAVCISSASAYSHLGLKEHAFNMLVLWFNIYCIGALRMWETWDVELYKYRFKSPRVNDCIL